MARWRCLADCGAVFDNGPNDNIENNAKVIQGDIAQPCPMCGEKAGFENLDYGQNMLHIFNKDA